jgi:hypothetical protein
MKKIVIFALLLLLLTGCFSTYIVKNNEEFVPMSELGLTGKQRFILHWRTMPDSPFALYDYRSERYFYKKNYNYTKMFKK